MSKIDLSKAKLGDKFRTRDGSVVEYVGYEDILDLYTVSGENNKPYPVHKDGRYLCARESSDDVIVQVLDESLDTIERDVRTNREMEKIVEVAKEEKQELQRRQEVVELAEKLVTNELFAVTNHLHDMRELGAAINLDSPTEYAFLIAEEFVNNKSKYLENGKLC